MKKCFEHPQDFADHLTNVVMHEIYGDEFDKNDDITEYPDMSKNWDCINEAIYSVVENL